jgi:hypothetical protein
MVASQNGTLKRSVSNQAFHDSIPDAQLYRLDRALKATMAFEGSRRKEEL